MQILLAFFVIPEIVKILLACELDQVYFVWALDIALNECAVVGPDAKQQSTVVLVHRWYNNVLKQMKSGLLSLLEIDYLCNVDHT